MQGTELESMKIATRQKRQFMKLMIRKKTKMPFELKFITISRTPANAKDCVEH